MMLITSKQTTSCHVALPLHPVKQIAVVDYLAINTCSCDGSLSLHIKRMQCHVLLSYASMQPSTKSCHAGIAEAIEACPSHLKGKIEAILIVFLLFGIRVETPPNAQGGMHRGDWGTARCRWLGAHFSALGIQVVSEEHTAFPWYDLIYHSHEISLDFPITDNMLQYLFISLISSNS